MDRPLIHMLVWMRVPGDTLFAVGAVLISVFVASLWLLKARRRPFEPLAQVVSAPAPAARKVLEDA
jgi:nitric oxide reductase subunit B